MDFLIGLVFLAFIYIGVRELLEKIKESDWFYMREARKNYISALEEEYKLQEKYSKGLSVEEMDEAIVKIKNGERIKIPYASFDYIYRHIDEFGIVDKNGHIVLTNMEAYERLVGSKQKKEKSLIEKAKSSKEKRKNKSQYIEVTTLEDGSVVTKDFATNDISVTIKEKDDDKTHINSSKSQNKDKGNTKHQDKDKNAVEGNSEPVSKTTPVAALPAPEVKELQEEIQRLEEEKRKAQDEADTDVLTRANNRNKFNKDTAEISHDVLKQMSAAFIDGDKFKTVNDTYKHEGGDEVLKMLSNVVHNFIRDLDIKFYRYGGEEFVILSKESDNKTLDILEKIRDHIEKNNVVFNEKTIPFTVSIGVAFGRNYADINELVNAADKMVYKAKENGRNRIEVESKEDDNKEEKETKPVGKIAQKIKSKKPKKDIEIYKILAETSPTEDEIEKEKNENKIENENEENKKENETVKVENEEKNETEIIKNSKNVETKKDEKINKNEIDYAKIPFENIFYNDTASELVESVNEENLNSFVLSVFTNSYEFDLPVIFELEDRIYIESRYFGWCIVRSCFNEKSAIKQLFYWKEKKLFLKIDVWVKIINVLNIVTKQECSSSELIRCWGDEKDKFFQEKVFKYNYKNYRAEVFQFEKKALECFHIDFEDIAFAEPFEEEPKGSFSISGKMAHILLGVEK